MKFGSHNKKFISAVLLIVLLLITTAGALTGGKESLSKTAGNVTPDITFEETEEAETPSGASDEEPGQRKVWQEGWVKYNGGIYAYNEEMITFLFMGTDQHGKNNAKSGGLDGGQADLLLIVAINPHKERIDFIPINRNTMTDVDVYDEDGNAFATTKAQIAVQHGVGDGRQESCEYQVKAISRYLYQLPVHGYVAMTMDGIIPLSNAVGGVDVVVPEDAVTPSFNYKKGQEIHLEGKTAYNFVRDRDQELGGADRRLGRQKVFLKALFGKTISAIRTKPSTMYSIYEAITEYTTTDIPLNIMFYVASECVSYRFDESSFHTIEGETVEGEISDEFYPDRQKLKELMIEIFYEKVDS